MKIICPQEELSRFLQTTSRALATKSTLSILTGIMLETKNNQLRCVATDLEIAIEANVSNIQIINPGAVVLPGKTFVDIVRYLPGAPVTIEFDENVKMVTISSQSSSYQLPVLPFEEFPALPELKESNRLEVQSGLLKEAIRQTMYATLADDPRPFLSSILWEIVPERLRLVATDVNRLAIKDIPAVSNFQVTALVPVRSLREIANIFGGSNEDNLGIYLNDKLLFINGSGITFSSRLVEAQFPRYEQVIPKDFSGSLLINRNQLIDALERTALVSHSIKLNLSDKKIIITAKQPDKGSSYEEISGDFSGKEMEIGFNVRFILDFLKAIDTDTVVFKYIHDQKPALLQGEGNDDYQYVLMPLKLSV